MWLALMNSSLIGRVRINPFFPQNESQNVDVCQVGACIETWKQVAVLRLVRSSWWVPLEAIVGEEATY